jgi:hypothetical protein
MQIGTTISTDFKHDSLSLSVDSEHCIRGVLHLLLLHKRRVPVEGPSAPCGICGNVTRTSPFLHGTPFQSVSNIAASSLVNVCGISLCTNPSVCCPLAQTRSHDAPSFRCIPGRTIVQFKSSSSSSDTGPWIIAPPRFDEISWGTFKSMCRNWVLSPSTAYLA